MAKNHEAAIQAAVVQYVRAVAPNVLIFAVPNGGLRTKREAALLKWTGVVAGISDLILLTDDGEAALWEVKTEKGRLTADQQKIAQWCLDSGFRWRTIRSVDDARSCLKEMNIQTRESLVCIS